MPRFLIALLLSAAAIALGSSRSAIAQEIGLGPPVTRPDAMLTLRGELALPQAVDGTDETGRPVFVPAARGAFFLVVDVRAARGNKNGFGLDEFVPYLTVSYALKPKAGGEPVQGQLHQFVTRRGLRYGNNVPAPAPGPYTLTLTIEPPIKVGFGRHTDTETGVARWWQPFQVEWIADATRVAKP
jgi:uncharacterized protein involved in high-affinity Fe2+ transport